MSAELDWQHEQPRKPGCGGQCHAEHADPVAGEKREYGTFRLVAHSQWQYPRCKGQPWGIKKWGFAYFVLRAIGLPADAGYAAGPLARVQVLNHDDLVSLFRVYQLVDEMTHQ